MEHVDSWAPRNIATHGAAPFSRLSSSSVGTTLYPQLSMAVAPNCRSSAVADKKRVVNDDDLDMLELMPIKVRRMSYELETARKELAAAHAQLGMKDAVIDVLVGKLKKSDDAAPAAPPSATVGSEYIGGTSTTSTTNYRTQDSNIIVPQIVEAAATTAPTPGSPPVAVPGVTMKLKNPNLQIRPDPPIRSSADTGPFNQSVINPTGSRQHAIDVEAALFTAPPVPRPNVSKTALLATVAVAPPKVTERRPLADFTDAQQQLQQQQPPVKRTQKQAVVVVAPPPASPPAVAAPPKTTTSSKAAATTITSIAAPKRLSMLHPNDPSLQNCSERLSKLHPHIPTAAVEEKVVDDDNNNNDDDDDDDVVVADEMMPAEDEEEEEEAAAAEEEGEDDDDDDDVPESEYITVVYNTKKPPMGFFFVPSTGGLHRVAKNADGDSALGELVAKYDPVAKKILERYVQTF